MNKSGRDRNHNLKIRKAWMQVFVCFGLFMLTGCLQVKEHLTINRDGTGILEVQRFVLAGTIKLLDNMFDTTSEGLNNLFQAEDQEAGAPESMAVEMFASKDQIIEKAEKAGIKIEFVNFDRQMRGDDIQVNYTIKFDDINKFLDSELITSRLALSKDPEGNLIVSLKEDFEKAKEAEMKAVQFSSFKQSEDFKALSQETQDLIVNAMEKFKSEFSLTLPNPIVKTSGIFKQNDPYTAGFEISGNILDSETINKLCAMSVDSAEVISSSQDLDFPIKAAAVEEKLPPVPQYPLGSNVRVYLKNGNTADGMLMEQNQEYIGVDIMEVSIIYYLDEIKKLRLNPDKQVKENDGYSDVGGER